MPATAMVSDRRRIFATALLLAMSVWTVASAAAVIWFYYPGEDLGLFGVAVPFIGTQVGFAAGAVALFAAAGATLFRRRDAFLPICAALLVYFLPLAAWVLFSSSVLQLVPVSASLGDVESLSTAVAGPAAFVCGWIGTVLAWTTRTSLQRSVFRAAAPALVGLLLGTMALGNFVLSRAEFWRRGDIQVSLDEFHRAGSSLTASFTVKLQESGSFRYHAVYLQFMGGSSGARADRIAWDGGTGPTAPGQYRLILSWDDVPFDRRAEKRMIFLKVYETGVQGEEEQIADLRFEL